MKHERDFKDFLSKRVDLNQDRLDTLKGRIETITKLLKENLSGYRKFSEQGSYAHKTIIKPVKDNDEFDADLLIFIQDSDFNPNDFKTDYVRKIYEIFKNNGNYEDKINKKTRCVTINYAGDFHLDIVPCVEHNEVHYITNRNDSKYEPTDGDGYKQWLAQKNEIVGNNNFRKVTRLLKFLRDHKDNFSVKSILLTTLLGNMVQTDDKDSESFSDLPTTLKTLSNRLNNFLQNRPSMPIIKNPVMSSEDFNRHWDEVKYKNFREKFNSYNGKINQAFEEEDYNSSVKKWRELFGDHFGRLIDSSSSRKESAILPTVPATKPYAFDDRIFK